MENEKITQTRKGRNIVFTIFACLMTGIIVFLSSSLGQNIYNSYNPNHSSSVKKSECSIGISDDDLIRIYDILGVKKLEHLNLGLNMFLSGMNKETSNLTLAEKKELIFLYAVQEDIIHEIENPTTKEVFDGFTIENFDRIKEYYGITEDYTMFFESNMIHNGYVLYNKSGIGTTAMIKHNFSSKMVDKDIIITDNATITDETTEEKRTQTIEYKFSKNSKDEYYLVSSIKIK